MYVDGIDENQAGNTFLVTPRWKMAGRSYDGEYLKKRTWGQQSIEVDGTNGAAQEWLPRIGRN